MVSMIRNPELDSKKSVPIEFFGILYFGLLVAVGLMLVWQPAQVATMNQELMALEETLKDLKMRNEDLKRTVATMESLTFIEAQARDVLGMTDPIQVRAVAVNIDNTNAVVKEDSDQLTADEQAPGGLFAWISRVAEFMRDNLIAAKERR